MKTYKTLKHLEKRCIKNNGKSVEIWNDDGIKVNGKIYRQMEYGKMGYKFQSIRSVSYVTFRNTGKKGRQPTYANRENFEFGKDSFITIEYLLHNTNIFEFLLIRTT